MFSSSPHRRQMSPSVHARPLGTSKATNVPGTPDMKWKAALSNILSAFSPTQDNTPRSARNASVTIGGRSPSPGIQRLYDDAANRDRRLRTMANGKIRAEMTPHQPDKKTYTLVRRKMEREAVAIFDRCNHRGEMSYSQFKSAIVELNLTPGGRNTENQTIVDETWVAALGSASQSAYITVDDFVEAVVTLSRRPECSWRRLSQPQTDVSTLISSNSPRNRSSIRSSFSSTMDDATLHRLCKKDTRRLEIVQQQLEEQLANECTFKPNAHRSSSSSDPKGLMPTGGGGGTVAPRYMDPKKDYSLQGPTAKLQAELKECTFKPQIFSSSSHHRLEVPVHAPWGYSETVRRLRKGSRERERRKTFQESLRSVS